MDKPVSFKPVLIFPRKSLQQEALDQLVTERDGNSMMFFEETPLSDDFGPLSEVVKDYQSFHVVAVLAMLPHYNLHHFRKDDQILALHSTPIFPLKLRSYDLARQEAATFYNHYLSSKKRR